MKFLFAAIMEHGHLQPLLPFAEELRTRGHDVRFCGPALIEPAVARRGFAFSPAGPPAGVRTFMTDADQAELDRLDEVGRIRSVGARFSRYAEAMVPDVLAAVRYDKPDLIVRGSSATGAMLAGELASVPVASIDYGRPGPAARRLRGELLDPIRLRLGLPPDPEMSALDRDLSLAPCVVGWYNADEIGPTTNLLQPADETLTPDEAALPWLATLGRKRPAVYATLGTAFNETPGAFEAIFEALHGEELDVVATIGPSGDPDRFPDLPSHIHVEHYVPQSLVLDRCVAVVCHAGYGSLTGALRRGLPVVTIPMGAADNLANARRVERLGAGIAITPENRTAASVGTAFRKVLGRPGYRASAQTVARATDALPDLGHGANLLEQRAST